MQEENLLCVRKRHFVIITDSAHGLPLYPNMVPTLTVTTANQLWLSNITYVGLRREFIYLAVTIDAALQQAFAMHTVAPGLVHHSDLGVQYAMPCYAALFKAYDLQISMRRCISTTTKVLPMSTLRLNGSWKTCTITSFCARLPPTR